MNKIIYMFVLMGFMLNMNAQNILFSFSIDEDNSTPAEMRVDVLARATADETLVGYTSVFYYDDLETVFVSYDESTAEANGWLTAGNFTVTDATPASVPAGVPAGLTRRIELQQFDGNFAGSGISSTAVKVGTLVFDNLNAGDPNTGSEMFMSNTAIDAGIEYVDAGFVGHNIVIEGEESMVLPIELSEFTAKKRGESASILDWVTASEINSSHFEIERAMDGVSFETLGKENAAGNSTDVRTYQFVDANVPLKNGETIAYYRLKMVDIDGAYDYSETRAVSFEGHGDVVTVHPNPTVNFINVDAQLDIERVTIYDATGKVVFNQTTNVSTIDMTGYDSGMYKVVVSTEAGDQVKSVVKID